VQDVHNLLQPVNVWNVHRDISLHQQINVLKLTLNVLISTLTKTNVKVVTVDTLCCKKNVRFPKLMKNTRLRTVLLTTVIKNAFNASIDFICRTTNAKMLTCFVKLTTWLQVNVQAVTQPLNSTMANVQNDLSPILFTTLFYFLFSLTNNSHLITPILTSFKIIFKKMVWLLTSISKVWDLLISYIFNQLYLLDVINYKMFDLF